MYPIVSAKQDGPGPTKVRNPAWLIERQPGRCVVEWIHTGNREEVMAENVKPFPRSRRRGEDEGTVEHDGSTHHDREVGPAAAPVLFEVEEEEAGPMAAPILFEAEEGGESSANRSITAMWPCLGCLVANVSATLFSQVCFILILCRYYGRICFPTR